MRIEPIQPKEPTFGMKMIKTGVNQPLQWSTKNNKNSKEFHYIRNGLKLDVFELTNGNKTYKGKIISDLMDNPIVAKVQELVNGIKIKEKKL